MDIVRAAETLAMTAELPPKSPIDHHLNDDKKQKTTTIVMSKHTLDTPQLQVCLFYINKIKKVIRKWS